VTDDALPTKSAARANPGRRNRALLRRASLFSELSDTALDELAARFSERSYARGDTLWQAADEGEELIVVVSGELAVMGRDPDGSERTVGRIGPGECAGEMALVLDERRSATVVCRREALVLVLEKEDFRRVIRDNAAMLASLTELLSRRAMALARRRPVSRAPVVVGVVAEPGVPGASLVAAAVAQSAPAAVGCEALLIRVGGDGLPLGSRTRPDDIAAALGPPTGVGPVVLDMSVTRGGLTGSTLARAVDAVLAASADRFRLVVIDLPAVPAGALALAAAACDSVVHVTAEPTAPPDTRARVFPVVNRYPGAGAPLPLNHCEPFVLPREPSWIGFRRKGEPLRLADAAHPAARVVHRLTRKLMGVTVGIALGGGGAFGIAHVGVLAALAEGSVPIDLVAGTSMGSIVALGYATGLQPPAMVEIARRIGNVRTALSVIDPSLSGTGLLSGRRLVSIFGPLLTADGFDELEVPCRVVAMDVETGGRVDIGSGRLDTAFRASCSIPVVFTPVSLDGRTLVDGGMIDPVPADVVRDMGADIVIAVNVVPRLERGTTTAISRTFKKVSRLNPLAHLTRSSSLPDIVDVFMNSLQATQFELGNFKSLAADVLVNVDMAEFTWIDFHRALDIIERGRRAGERVVPEVRAAMDRRLAPSA
jgi:NTE family protein